MLFGSASAPVLSCEMGRFGDLLFSIGVKRRLVIAVVVVQEHHRIFLELHRPWGQQMGEKTPDENHEWPWWSCLLYECYWGFDLFWLFPLETVSDLDLDLSITYHHTFFLLFSLLSPAWTDSEPVRNAPTFLLVSRHPYIWQRLSTGTVTWRHLSLVDPLNTVSCTVTSEAGNSKCAVVFLE